MHQNVHYPAFRNIHRNILEMRHEIQFVQYALVLLHITVALSGALMIVESHARRNYVDYGKPVMRNRGLEQCL